MSIPKIIALVDFENILFSLPVIYPGENFLLETAFDKFIKWLEGIGEIKSIFIFGSEKSIFSRRINLYKLNWFPILCPKIKRWVPKSGYQFKSEPEGIREKDTSDAILMRFWSMLNDLSGWDILCLASGDIDFVPLARETLRRERKIAIAAVGEIPLASELKEIASLDPKTGKPMVHYFYPIS
jgi:uncharacterized LabA/DUF88 family protein